MKQSSSSNRTIVADSLQVTPTVAAQRTTAKILTAMTVRVDAAFLAWFRIAFGIVMTCYALNSLITGAVRVMYVEPTFHIKYFGFHWVPVLPGVGMYAFFVTLAILAFLIAVGLCYRFASIAFAVQFTWLFLMDRTYYCLLYTSPSPRDLSTSRMPSSA